MRLTNSYVPLVAVLCAFAACTTANAEIDNLTVEAGRILINGKIDAAHDLVVQIDRGDKPIEWRSRRTGGGEFEVVVEASTTIRLDGGKTGHGFVVSTKMLTSSDVKYVLCAGEFDGVFAIRRESDFTTKDGVLTFADITLKDGKKLSVSFRLALKYDEQVVEKQTISRPIWLLVDAKTQKKIEAGNKGINNFMKPNIKRVELPKDFAAMTTLRNAKQKKDQNSERFPASREALAAFNRDWPVKSVNVTLADNSMMECRALVRMDDSQAVILDKDLIMTHTIEADSDQGAQTWYCYISTYEAPVAASADPAGHKRARHGAQGTWRIVSSQHTGDTFLFEENPTGLKIVVEGDMLTYFSRDEQGKYDGHFQLDPVTKAFDWSPSYSGTGSLTGATVPFRGIYELKGDELKIYFHETRWARPKTFEFKEGWLLVLNRNAKDRAPEDKEKAVEAIRKLGAKVTRDE